MRDRIREWYFKHEGEWVSWKKICEVADIPLCYGKAKDRAIDGLSKYCVLDRKDKMFSIVGLVGDRGRYYEEVSRICDILGLELAEEGVYNSVNDIVLCRCQKHKGEWTETDLHKLKRGNRPVKCCCSKVDKFAMSVAIYLRGRYEDISLSVDGLGLASIYIGELKRYIIFIRADQYNKAIDDKSVYIGMDTSLDKTYRNGNFIWHGGVNWGFKGRQEVYRLLNELIPFDYSEDNWLEAVGESLTANIIREEKFKIKINKAHNIVLYHNKVVDEEKVQLPAHFQRKKLDHVLILNRKNQIVGEYSSFSDIVEEMKSGKFYGLKILID